MLKEKKETITPRFKTRKIIIVNNIGVKKKKYIFQINFRTCLKVLVLCYSCTFYSFHFQDKEKRKRILYQIPMHLFKLIT